jgi:hypothetical protein
MEHGHPDLIAALDGVRTASDLDQVIKVVVDALEGPLQLWHASLVVVVPEQGVGRVLAAWSRTDSVFEAGTEVALSISTKIEQAVRILADGDAVIIDMGGGGGSLVDHLMQQQGVASALGIPVAARSYLFVLVLGGSDAPVLRELGKAFCLEVSDQLREPLERLPLTQTGYVGPR